MRRTHLDDLRATARRAAGAASGTAPARAPQPGGQPQGWTSYAAPPAVAAPERPGLVTAAGITMIVLGALITLFDLFVLLVGGLIGGAAGQFESDLPGFGVTAGAIAGIVIVVALVVLVIGILDIVSGVKVLGGRSWARLTGIVVGALLGLIGLLSLLASAGARDSDPSFAIVLLVANAFIVFALVTTGAWFTARSTGLDVR